MWLEVIHIGTWVLIVQTSILICWTFGHFTSCRFCRQIKKLHQGRWNYFASAGEKELFYDHFIIVKQHNIYIYYALWWDVDVRYGWRASTLLTVCLTASLLALLYFNQCAGNKCKDDWRRDPTFYYRDINARNNTHFIGIYVQFVISLLRLPAVHFIAYCSLPVFVTEFTIQSNHPAKITLQNACRFHQITLWVGQFNHCLGIHVSMHGGKRAWEFAIAGDDKNMD